MIDRLRRSLVGRLLAAQLLVIVAGSVTLTIVALSVAPGLFHRHVREALGIVPDDVAQHLDRAFGDAILVAIAVAIGAAALTALAVSWYVSVRIARPLGQLASAADRIAKGHYGERIAVTGPDELAALASAFNSMAGSLESTELRRRRLFSDLAHELRTPLATIEGYVEGVRDGVLPPTGETWSVLETESRRLRRLVDDLQEVSRAEERRLDLRVVEADPVALVARAIRAAGPGYESKGVRLETANDPHVPPVAADPDRLHEVLANLLENALRHTPRGGLVEVRTARRGRDVEISVSDSGEGIAPEHLERVFERFFRVDPARSRATGGSGIGLTIARAIVQAHGGRMWAESDGSDRGTRFVMWLPRSAAPEGGVTRARHGLQGPDTETGRGDVPGER